MSVLPVLVEDKGLLWSWKHSKKTVPKLLFEHEDFVVVDKPAGLLVHTNPRFPKEYPLLQRVRDQLGQHVYAVHRLDRQTSGCIVFARHPNAVAELVSGLKNGTKKYWAFVRGQFPHEQCTIETPIKTEKGNYLSAKSMVYCIAKGANPRSSLLRVEPQTGRRHQVRRHVRDLHHPVLHDGDHGDSRVNRWWKQHMGLHRLALHAYSITLCYHTQKIAAFSPLPDDLRLVFSAAPWWDFACAKEPLLCDLPSN